MKANITYHFLRLSKPIALAMFLIISSIVNAQTSTPATRFKGNQTYWVDGVGLDYAAPKDTFADLTGAHLEDSVFIQTTGLLTAFNNQGVDQLTLGQVTFMLCPGYSGTEANLISIGRATGGYPWMSSSRQVVIKTAPNYSVNITTTAPIVANTSLVRFNGAQFVTIDGAGSGTMAGQRSITFTVPSHLASVSGVRVVDVRAFATVGCRFLTVTNCRLVGSSSGAGVNTYAGFYSGGVSAPSAPALTSQNLTVTNNLIEGVQNGIYVRGVETIANRQDNTLKVSNNIISGDNLGTSYIGGANGSAGITLIAQKNAEVSGNTVRNNLPSQGGNFRGIQLSNTSTTAMDSNILITGNKIYNLRSTVASTGVYGIRIGFTGTHAQPLAITVSNNTIANMISTTTGNLISGGSNIVGMMVEDQSSNSGMSFYNNSVHLYGDTLNLSAISACFLTTAGVTGGLRVANNIFVNRLGRTLTTTGLSPTSYIYALGSTLNPFALIANNAYYVNNTSGAFSFIGAMGTSNNKSTMKTWSAAVNDNSSVTSIPPFVGNNNDTCFIATNSATTLGNYGIPVGVSTDIRGVTRSTTNPSLGAYEFTGNAAIANYSLKGGSTYLINGTSSWPVGPTATTGTFATIADAFTYLNTYGVAGNGTVNLKLSPNGSGYAGETTFIPHLLNYSGASASRVLLIDVAAGSSYTVSAPAIANVSTQYALLNMIGAKFVTINGSSVAGQRNLTFALPTTFTTPNINVIGLTTIDTDSITDITISNCNIVGSSSSTAIFTSSGIYHGGFNPTAGVSSANIGFSKNISIINNYVSAVRTGIYFRGANVANGQTRNVTIARNIIGGTTPQGTGSPVTYIGGVSSPAQAGILLKGVAIATVDSNIIRNCDSVGSVSNGFSGIALDVLSETNSIDSAITITKNTIYNLTTATGTYCAGIRINLGSSTGRSLRIINNSIAKIRGVGSAATGSNLNPSGIILDGTSANLDATIFHNTIQLSGTTLNPSLSAACVFIGSGITGGVRLENNLLTNRLGRLGAPSGNAYSLFVGSTSAAASPFNLPSSGSINGNTYGADAPNTTNNYVVGVGTTGHYFVKTWQTFMAQDFTSVSFVGFFLNDSTPVLDPRFAGIVYNGNVTKLAVPTDITGALRPTGFTCNGALQFTQDYTPLAGNETYLINGTNNFPRTSGTAPFSFATITDAINYLNTNGVDGLSVDVRRVTLKITAPYAGEPVDAFIPVIKQYPRQNAFRIVTLTTDAGRSDTIRTNTSQLYPNYGSVIRFLGGSHFEIDGNNGSGGRGITIALPNVANPNAANLKLIDIAPGESPVTNVRIRNCNLIGVSGANSISTFAGIYMGGVTTATPSQPSLGTNSNHVFENNFIAGVKYGIYAQGLQAGSGQQDKGLVIKRNVIGANATYAGNTLNWGGAANAAAIYLSAQANTLVDSNVISNNMDSFPNNRGIELTSSNTAGAFSVDSGITISRNTITGITNLTTAGGAYGIYMSFADSITPRNDRGFTIKNNMISDITAPGTTPSPVTALNNGANPIGIYVEETYPGLRGEVQGFGLRIWYNSINLGYGTSLTQASAFSSCIAFSSQIKGGVTMQNNILQNRLGRASGTGTAATVLMGSNSTIFTLSNNNIHFTKAPGVTNILLACSTTVAAPFLMDSVHEIMQFTRQDTMSLNFITNFTSETNLLLAGAAHHAFGWGAFVPAVNNDIQGELRSVSIRPTIGADELAFGTFVDSIAPRVYDVTKMPLFCNTGAPIPVTFRVFERNSVGLRDTLYYSVNDSAEHAIIGGTGVVTNDFTRTYNIPPLPDNCSIAYRLVIVDNSGQALKTNFPASGYNYTSTTFNTFPLTFGFDLPNVGGWTVNNNVNGNPSLGGWDINAFGSILNPVVLPKTGLKAALFPSFTLADGSVSRLVSPCLDFTNMKVPTVRIWVSQNAELPTLLDQVQVTVSGAADIWSAPLGVVVRANTNLVFPEFTQLDVCLSGYAGLNGMRVGIEGISKKGMNIVLDSIVIFDDVINQTISPLTNTVCAYNPLSLTVPSSSNTYQYTMVDTRNGFPLGASVLGNANGSSLTVTAPNPSNPAIARIDSVRAIIKYTNTLSGCVWQMPDTATINIKNFYGGPFMVQGAPFSGVYSNGTFAKPDGSKLGDTLTYAIAPPSGLTNAEYGSKWIVVGANIATPIEGRPFANYGFTGATSSTNAFITAKPSAADLDSTFKVAATIRFLPSGCDSTVVRYLKVSSSPTASFINTSDSVCSGAAIYFTNTTTAQANTYPLVYTWTFGDGTSASTGDANKIYAFDKAPGMYTVTLKATNNAGVFHTYSKQIRVLPAPLTTYTNGLACGTDAIAFTNTTTNAVSYLWKVSLNNQLKDTSTQVNPSFSFAIADTLYNVTLRATNTLGCFRDSVRGVFAFAKPIASFTTVNQCAGKNATFVNNSSISFGGTNRINTFGSFWDFGNGDIGLSNSPIYKYPKDSTYTVKLKVTSNYGCTDSTTRTVTIYEKPVTGFTTGIACQGDVVAVTNTTTYSGGLGRVRYAWDFGDFSPISNDPNPVKAYGVLGNFTIQLVAHDTIHNCYDTTSKQIEVNEVPFAGFAKVDGCVGSPIAFSNGSIPPIGQTLTYAWTFGDNTSSTATNPTHPYAAPGKFPVTMKATTNKGCFDSAADTVTIENIPSAVFAWDTLSMTTVWFEPGVAGLANYRWDFGDSTKLNSGDGRVENTYQVKGAHKVTLTVTSLNGCTGSHTEDSVMTYMTIGFDEIFSSKFKLSVYPNPFEDVANITYNLDTKENVTVTVMDVLGRKVSEVVENNQTVGNHTIQLDESKFAASGVYMVRIQIGDEAVTKQLVRQ